jgi:hypothetical protein
VSEPNMLPPNSTSKISDIWRPTVLQWCYSGVIVVLHYCIPYQIAFPPLPTKCDTGEP